MDRHMDYDRLYGDTLRKLVQTVLTRVAEEGLRGDRHFYISFRTNDAGVNIPGHLRTRYPDEMTIVLQNQFWDLTITDSLFEVTLSFNNLQEKLIIPFAAITSFVDPSVRFGLQCRGDKEPEDATTPQKTPSRPQLATAIREEEDAATTADQTEDDATDDATAEVIPLDSFRKK